MSNIELSTFTDLALDPVFLAAHFHLSGLFTRLISSRDINSRNTRGGTPLHRAVYLGPWQKGRELPFFDFQDARTWQKGREPPFLGSEQHAMVQVILDLGADVDAKDQLGMTAASRAVENEDGGILSLLLDHGADIDARSNSGDSLLQVAAKRKNCVDIMQFLLDRGADVKVLTEERESLVRVAVSNYASASLEWLIGHGAPFDIPDEKGLTPLMHAAGLGDLKMLTALIKRGARCDIADCNGRSPLHCAISPPSPDVVEVLMQNQNVDVIDREGRTPLHNAYMWSAMFSMRRHRYWKTRFVHVIRLLIEGGASETIADVEGKLPKEYSHRST